MKRVFATLVAFAVCSAVVSADVTVVQTTTVEGGMMAMGGGAAMSPKTTSRIKGQKMRSEVDAGMIQMVLITDLDAKQVIVLRPDQKTAQIVAQGGAASSALPAGLKMPKVDASMTPTGKSQMIDGIKCDEYAIATTIDMSEMGGPQMPPEATAAMKDVKMVMKGSMWVAKNVPGAAEYIAFQKGVGSSDFGAIFAGAAGMSVPGMDRMMKAMSNLDGIAYMTEMTMTVEGTGQMAQMMQQMGAMRITTKVTSITGDPISDEMFKIPEGYTVSK